MTGKFLDMDVPTFRAIWRRVRAVLPRMLARLASLARVTVNRKTAMGAFVVILALFLIHSVLMVVWGRQLEGRLAELRAAGKPVNCADLVQKPIPDSENAAVTYAKAFDVLKELSDSGLPSDMNVDIMNMKLTAQERAALEPEVRKVVRDCEAVLPLLEEAVSKRGCVFPVRWQDGYAAVFPQWGRMRALSRLLQGKAYVEAADGRMDAAIGSSITGLRVAGAADNDPSFIGFMVRTACTKWTLYGLREATRLHSLSPQQARRMYDELGTISLTPGLITALEGERAFANRAFDEARAARDPGDLVNVSRGLMYIQGKVGNIRRRVAAYLWRPISYKDQMVYMDVIDNSVQDAGIPYRDIVKRASSAKSTEEVEPTLIQRLIVYTCLPDTQGWSLHRRRGIPQYAVLTQFLSPEHPRMLAVEDSAMAEVGMAQVAMALKAHKSRFGEYPVSLADLEAKVGWRLPDDPFSGKPFVYKRSGAGFVLYSWAMDLKDDGGREWDNSGTGDQVWVSEV